MKILHLFFVIMILSASFAYAEDVVTYLGTSYLDCQNIGNTNVFLNDPNDYATIKPGYIFIPDGCKSLPGISKYRKIVGKAVIEMTQAEKDAVDAAEAQAQKDAEISRIDAGNVSGEEVLKALPVVISTSASYKEITETAIKEEIKKEKGLI